MKINRSSLLLGLDILMLLLTCMLQGLSLTGLSVHEWLGFVLCPLVLLHVVLQWQWFVTQFRRILKPGAGRARVNTILNLLLFILMAAVLISGILISNQVAPLVGEHLGRPRVWSEIHGWLNFSLIVAVGLHVAINWDWIIGAMRRRAPAPPAQNAAASSVRSRGFANSLGRGVVVFMVASFAAVAVYLTMAGLMRGGEARRRIQNERNLARHVQKPVPNQTLRNGRPVSLSGGLNELCITVSIVAFVALFARYVLGVRLQVAQKKRKFLVPFCLPACMNEGNDDG